MKAETGKTQWRLLPFDALEQVARAFMFGNSKEGRKPDDWQLVPNKREAYFDACMRHLTAWWRGGGRDGESGLSHLAHAACCILILLWDEIRGGGK